MPDIAMCKNKTCTKKYNCYRYMATPSPENQYYFKTSPNDNNEHCHYFMGIAPNDGLNGNIFKT